MPQESSTSLSLLDRLAPRRSALVVIDMQNDFCAPGGYVDAVMGKDVSAAAALLPVLNSLIAHARGAGVPVVWVRADYGHAAIPSSMLAKQLRAGIHAECCAAGTWGADWFGVAPLPTEPVVTKHTYSGFHDTDLDAVLRGKQIETLVFAGVQTQICVESTVRDGHSRGYDCIVPADAVASHTPMLHDATLMNVRFLFGDVSDSATILAAWTPSASTATTAFA